jgi:small GTP-binding protein
MSHRSNWSAIWLLIALAGVGALLVAAPPVIVSQYERAQRLGNVAGTVYLATMGVGAALLIGVAAYVGLRLWRNTREKRQREAQAVKNPSQLSAAEKRREVDDNLAAVRDLQDDPAADPALKGQLDPLADRVAAKTENQTLEIVAFGTISSGKSSLLNALAGRDVFATDLKGGTTLARNEIPWPGNNQVILVDTPGLGEVEGLARQATAAVCAKDADLVLLVVDGPLRDSEFRLLAQLAQMEKRVLICLNKEDWYGEHERERLLEQIREQTREQVDAQDVIAVRSRPTSRVRMRVGAGGSQDEEHVTVGADIQPLAERMLEIVRRDGRDLLLANLLLQSRGLVEEAKRRVQASLDRRAWQIVDRYMWGAGGAAAVSPFPLVDLAAGCAISSKMVLDLARVYRQKIDADAAVKLLGQMGKQLIGVLGVSVAAPAVTSAVASLLKTVPGAGTIAGGALQGLVVALIARWIGAIFIEYFKHEMQEPPGGLANIARREWERLTTVDELRKLIQTAHRRLVKGEDK